MPEPRMDRGEPEYDGGVPADEPEEAPTVERPCPDPDCGGTYRVWADVVESGGYYAVPAHYPASYTGGGSVFTGRCWLSGVPLREAVAFVAIREADGGRIKTAAHP